MEKEITMEFYHFTFGFFASVIVGSIFNIIVNDKAFRLVNAVTTIVAFVGLMVTLSAM